MAGSHLASPVLLACCSGSEDLWDLFLERLQALAPDLPLLVVSEFAPGRGEWIPYNPKRSFADNLLRCREALRGSQVRFAGVLLQPRMPYWRLRWLAHRIAPTRVVYFNENLDHFLLRPRAAKAVARHLSWRAKNFVRWQLRPGGAAFTLLWRMAHPAAFRRPFLYRAALAAGELALLKRRALRPVSGELGPGRPIEGVSVVIPSRSGRELLERLLPGLMAQLPERSEVIVVDNGSDDGTAPWLAAHYPGVKVETHTLPLSFAKAANRGIALARFSHTLLLNNDMVLEEGFFPPLLLAFQQVPGLFCATAQIFFPSGARREETGKAVMPPLAKPVDFPVRCDLPLEGEDGSYVLYGSGGCSLYETRKLKALGGFGEVFAPAYVEDLDLGFRAWQRGWPSVFVSGARLEHRHRATTSRFLGKDELELALERNYLRFLARSVADPKVFRRLWSEAIRRLNLLAADTEAPPSRIAPLRAALDAPDWVEPAPAADEELILALGSGAVAVFPGARRPSGKPVVLVASPYVPFPLSHGGAVRMFNLLREGAQYNDQVLMYFTEEWIPPPKELLELFLEIVVVRRVGSHTRPLTHRPDVVEEFDSLPFRAALRQTMRKWKPGIAQLEFTQMAQYAPDCAPAQTILVEHDVTLDLYRQLYESKPSHDLRQQFERWVSFEHRAWSAVDCVVTMSSMDAATIHADYRQVLPNGVDLERFQPAGDSETEPARILFLGSFAHLPNLIAIDWFLREAWPRLWAAGAVLHIIAGARHEHYLELYRDRVQPQLIRDSVILEGFVSDVRPAYRKAQVVIAPLRASVGTNIKIMEAMAMGKAIVSTPRGVNGLDLESGEGVLIEDSPEGFAEAVLDLLRDAGRRRELERTARRIAEERYDWKAIGVAQQKMYQQLRATAPPARPGPTS
ncbi:MAG: glycosyltransferase [Bryobacteraceae bacterium]|nr:glycosyltransferase [Bryobacteraceae bacterium]